MIEQIIILDFGSQYTQVIARRIREGNVYCTILPYHTPARELAALAPRGLVLSGGPASVYAPKAPLPDKEIFNLGVPVLGICYGLQLLAQYLGGKVEPGQKREYGKGTLTIKDALLYSAVCGTGLDTVPLAGNTTAEQMAPLLLDLCALALRLDKPLTARLMPVPGKKVGDSTEYDFGFFANSKVMNLESEPLQGALAKNELIKLSSRRQ